MTRGRAESRLRRVLAAAGCLAVAIGTAAAEEARSAAESRPRMALIGIGDSLGHGTMDARNNATSSLRAYLQLVANSLGLVTDLEFTQPIFDNQEGRLFPYTLPTNLSVDGADVFSIEGLEYYKRVGAPTTTISPDHVVDEIFPFAFDTNTDKVLFPINLLAKRSVSQVGAAIYLQTLFSLGPAARDQITILWAGNNDSSLAALGLGGANPSFLPIPFEATRTRLKPLVRILIGAAAASGALRFDPYTMANVSRNLTEAAHYEFQLNRVVSRLRSESIPYGGQRRHYLLTMPYYSSVGHLMDSEDLEYYFQKVTPAYEVPPTFERVAPPGEEITDPNQGDRVSLLTFGFMYAMLSTGFSVAEVNAVLEQNGQQVDGLVLSQSEREFIQARIDDFNDSVAAVAAAAGPGVEVIDTGKFLNDALLEITPIVINGKKVTRKWIRGGAFSFDGVHPGYAGQAFIANFVLEHLNSSLGLQAPLYNLDHVAQGDVYQDNDGDGWAPGPPQEAPPLASLLYLFKDPDDTQASVEVVLPPDVWDQFSDAILAELLGGLTAVEEP